MSFITVQKAFDRLKRDGFINTRRRGGTCVVERPPHLHHYGIVFQSRPEPDRYYSSFWLALQRAALEVGHDGQVELTQYFHDLGRRDSAEYKRLRHDVQARRLAGLIFATPWHAMPTEFAEALAKVPAVGIMPEAMGAIRAITPRGDSMVEAAVAWFREWQHTRIALFCMVDSPAMFDAQVAILRRHDVTIPPEWRIATTQVSPLPVRNVANLLMQLPVARRPDAVLVMDDNLAEHVAAGLEDGGARLGRDVLLVTDWNFPNATPLAGRIKRIGFDCREIVATSLQVLRDVRAGKEVPPVTEVSAITDEDYEAATRNKHPAAPSAYAYARQTSSRSFGCPAGLQA